MLLLECKRQKIIATFTLLFLTGCFLLFLTSLTADAALVPCGRTPGEGVPEAETLPCTLCHLLVGIHRIIGWGFKILTFVAVASLVGAGIMYIVSAGNEKLMETAKTFAKHTLMGFSIVLAAWLIVNYTMILLSKKADLGIGVDKWNEFNCDTSSDLGAGAPMNPNTGSSGGNPPAQSEKCGIENAGFCYDGTWYNPCPPGARHLTGGKDCPSGEYCCSNNIQ